MSKSQGNSIAPEALLPKYGAEVLRLWVAAEDYTEDVRISYEILDRLADAYRRIRNTCRFLLGTLADFDPDQDRVSYAADGRARPLGAAAPGRADRARAEGLRRVPVPRRLPLGPQLLRGGPVGALPRHHQGPPLRVGALRPEAARGADRVLRDLDGARAARGAGADLHGGRGLGPHSRERQARRACTSCCSRRSAGSGSTSASAGTGSDCSRCGARCRARWRRRASRDASARASTPSSTSRARPRSSGGRCSSAKGEALLTTLFNVSGVRLATARARGRRRPYESQDIPGLTVEVLPAQDLGWKKCERCWTWSTRVGEDATHPTLCERCVPVVRALRP